MHFELGIKARTFLKYYQLQNDLLYPFVRFLRDVESIIYGGFDPTWSFLERTTTLTSDVDGTVEQVKSSAGADERREAELGFRTTGAARAEPRS